MQRRALRRDLRLATGHDLIFTTYFMSTQPPLSNRVAIITGGARGIGYAISERLLQSGASVCLWDVDPDALDGAKVTLSSIGPVATAQVDVTDENSVEAATHPTLAAFGKIDLLVNNAGKPLVCLVPLPYCRHDLWS